VSQHGRFYNRRFFLPGHSCPAGTCPLLFLKTELPPRRESRSRARGHGLSLGVFLCFPFPFHSPHRRRFDERRAVFLAVDLASRPLKVPVLCYSSPYVPLPREDYGRFVHRAVAPRPFNKGLRITLIPPFRPPRSPFPELGHLKPGTPPGRRYHSCSGSIRSRGSQTGDRRYFPCCFPSSLLTKS